MKRHVQVLLASLALLLAAVFGLLLRQTAPAVISGEETVERKNTVVGQHYVQIGSITMLLGDISDNGKVDTTDARLILQIAAGMFGDENNLGVNDLLEYEFLTADVNQDDAVNTTDARLILQAAAGLITEFPDRVTTTTTTTTTAPTTAPTRKEASLSSEPVEDLTKATNAVVNDDPDTFCNPINIAYAYRDDSDNGYREGADPVVQVYRGEYYLFVSHNNGYWWSDDLVDWQFVYCMDAEMEKWAPATVVVGDTMYLTHSESGAIFKSTDPKSGTWEYVGKPVDWGDPALFYDDDGYVYCYYGLSDNAPLYVVRLDPTDNMALVDGPFECFYQNRQAHGFENPGENNEKDQNGWMEGAWVVKHEGKYYFNYAVPGTEYASYANGCYVSEDPLGPFEFCENSPVSYKSTGYLVGAGHGATFQDLWGNWWKVDTVAIAGETSWERRVELIPLTYDKNGNQITDTLMLDYPTYVPALIEDNFGDQAQPDWNLLSYEAAVSASSTLDAAHDGKNAVNESIRSWWSAATGNAGEWITIDMGKLCEVNAVQINFADQDADVFTGRDHTFCYNYLVEFSQDGETWYTLADHTGVTAEPFEAKDTSHDYYELVSAIGARYIRVTNKGEIPAGGKFALSGIRVFGNGQGEAPAAVSDFTVDRPTSDERRVTVTWDAVDGAEGYIVRYGYAEDVLSQAYQVIGDTSMSIRALNMGVDYWFTVDAYNDSGYTKGTTVKSAPATQPAPEGTPVEPPKVIDYIVEGYTVYEAEAAALGNGAVASRGAEDAKASGSASVHNMHLAGAYFEVTGVDGGEGGNALLHLGYANGNSMASIEIIVNGVSQGRTVLATSGGWSRFKAVEIPLTGLKAGEENTIRIVGGIDQGFNPDFIQVVYDK